MSGESDLTLLLKNMKPELHKGEFVFCQVPDHNDIPLQKIICLFRETEGLTLILSRVTADELHLSYSYVSAWITLTVHSSLESVGLTAAFSNALARSGISCNVVAACNHDHIFVHTSDAPEAIQVLEEISKR